MNKNLWFVGFVVAVIGFFMYRVRTILTPFLFAAVIAYIIYPLVEAFEKRQVPRPMAILVVYLILGSVFGLVFWIMIPQLAEQMDEILAMLPSQAERLEGLGKDAVRSLQNVKLPVTIQEAINLIMGRIQLMLEDMASRLAEMLVSILSHMLALVIAPVLAFYFLRDHEVIRERFFLYVPMQYRANLKTILREINKALNGFFRGQIIVSSIVGFLVYVGLAILGVRYALFIGLLAGLFDIIPYFGPIIGFLPAAGFAMLKSPVNVLWVVVIFVLANQIESNIIAPKIIGDRVGLHPLAVIFAVLTGGELMGLVGMLVAVPTAAIVRVLLRYFASKHSGSPL